MAMAKPKKKATGISKDDLTKFLLNNLLGSESLALGKQAAELDTPRNTQGGMANQFGAAGLNDYTRKLLGQLGLAGEAVAKSNVSDILGFKDAFKYSEKGKPEDALNAILGIAPIGLGKAGKRLKKTGATGAKIAGGMVPNDIKNLWKLITQGQND
jgi:hypothetical protein